jgi:hypothetical protein
MSNLTADGRANTPDGAVRNFCLQLMDEGGYSDEEIAEAARDRFKGRTSHKCVKWYRSHYRRGASQASSSL